MVRRTRLGQVAALSAKEKPTKLAQRSVVGSEAAVRLTGVALILKRKVPGRRKILRGAENSAKDCYETENYTRIKQNRPV